MGFCRKHNSRRLGIQNSLCIILVISVALPSLVSGESGDNYPADPANSALSYLRLHASARSAALGGAVSALRNDLPASTVNPSLVGTKQAPNAALTAEIMTLDRKHFYAGGSYPLESIVSAIGINWTGYGVEDIEGRDFNGNIEDNFGSWSNTIGACYGGAILGNFFAGMAVNYHTQNLDTANASGWSGDAGLAFFPGRHISLALSARNLGLAQEWSTGAKDNLAPSYRFGIAADSLWNKLLISSDGEWTDGNSPQAHAGVEFRVLPSFAVRCGLEGPNPIQAGFGIGLGFAEIAIDYSFLIHTSDLGNSQFITLRWEKKKS